MKELLVALRALELGEVDLRAASPASLFDLEAALLFALAEVRRQRTALRTDGVRVSEEGKVNADG